MEKTYKASIINLTKRKREWLDFDYNNYQWWMIFGIDNGILSAFKANKNYKQKIIKYKEYSMPLWSAHIKNWLRKRDTKLTEYWIKIPNSKRKGIGIWLPLKFHQPLPNKFTIKDSLLVKKNNKYYLHLTLDILKARPYIPNNIIGIDLGLKNLVTSVNLSSKETKFLGKEIKQIRGKYYYLRKKLGKEKNIKQIKKIRNKEKNKVNTLLHNLSKSIVLDAFNNKSAICIGKLEDLKKNKGRKFNRRLSNFPYYKLTQFITYKAKEKGVPVILVNEAHTSKTCHVCGMKGSRTKNWFKCECKYEDNADRNAAFNIGKRGLNYMLGSGVLACAQKSLKEEISIKSHL